VPHWVIVGGGTAGCVLAGRLSESIDDHVTLIEAGPSLGERAPSYLDDLAAPGALWDGLVATDGSGPARPYPQGRGLGGSSAVNGGLLGNTHADALLPGVQIPSEAPHPSQLGVIDRGLLAVASDATVADLARRAGRPVSAADAYLAPARTRDNLDVVTDAVVDRVTFAGRNATGVVLAGGERIGADRVVAAAGSVFTPALLLRSGVDTPGIGDGLRDHVGRVVELTLRRSAEGEDHGLVTGAVLRRGAIEVVPMNHLGPICPGRAALLVGLLSNQRRGTVRLPPDALEDPTASPRVDFGTLGAADMIRLAAGMTMARELLAAAAFADVVADVRVVEGFGGYAHATSTCAIGTVADERGAVIGYQGLFVGDAAALPSLPACGTYLPVVLLAERLARAWRTI
jgi:choline dehydrogenase-like flavoprotein